jgi:hypothetical protein
VRSRLGHEALCDTAAVLGTFLVLGVVGGLLWWLLVEPAEFTVTRRGPSMSELELSRRFAADGWYSVIAVVAGFLGGVGITWWRARDPVRTTLLLVPGAVLASLVMVYAGGLLGPDGSRAALDQVRNAESVSVELAVSGLPFYLMWPTAALAGALMVLWSSSPADPRSGCRPASRADAG